jgi:hypothetical protein
MPRISIRILPMALPRKTFALTLHAGLDLLSGMRVDWRAGAMAAKERRE